jgi:hypothetical protein
MVDGKFVEVRSTMHQHGLGFVDLLRFLVKFFPLLVCVREEFSGTRHGGDNVYGEVIRARKSKTCRTLPPMRVEILGLVEFRSPMRQRGLGFVGFMDFAIFCEIS